MGLIPDSEHVTCISLYLCIDSEYGLDGLIGVPLFTPTPLLILDGLLMLISMEFHPWKPELFIAEILTGLLASRFSLPSTYHGQCHLFKYLLAIAPTG